MIISTSATDMDVADNEWTPEEEDGPKDMLGDGLQAQSREVKISAAQHGKRLDQVLVEIAPEFSRSYLQKLLADGAVYLDQAMTHKASQRVSVGSVVQVELRPTPDVLAFRPEPIALDVLYEDEDVLVINKPAGLVVHPAAGNWSGTLLNGLLARDARAARLPRAGIVHRLDKDTSGLMVVGRTILACTELVRMIAAREVKREYVALAHGNWPQCFHTQLRAIDAPVGRDPRSRLKMAVVAQGKPARTDVFFLADNADVGKEDAVTLVRCQLHSGRTHQIRVHMAHIGAPLVGDVLYGGRQAYGMQRQALHAWRLTFRHPVTGKELFFEQVWPDDVRRAVKKSGVGYNSSTNTT